MVSMKRNIPPMGAMKDTTEILTEVMGMVGVMEVATSLLIAVKGAMEVDTMATVMAVMEMVMEVVMEVVGVTEAAATGPLLADTTPKVTGHLTEATGLHMDRIMAGIKLPMGMIMGTNRATGTEMAMTTTTDPATDQVTATMQTIARNTVGVTIHRHIILRVMEDTGLTKVITTGPGTITNRGGEYDLTSHFLSSPRHENRYRSVRLKEVENFSDKVFS